LIHELRPIGCALACAAALVPAIAEAGFVPRWNFEPDQAGAHAGFSIADAGDVNGDGYNDLLVGVPFADGAGGCVYLFLGTASGPRPRRRGSRSPIRPVRCSGIP